MTIERIPIASTIDPESFLGDSVSGSTTLNCVYDRYQNGTIYATQRSGVTVVAEPGFTTVAVDDAGRGIYFWRKANSLYTVNNDLVNIGYSVPVGTITPGRDRVYIEEVGNSLVFIDSENNEGWYIDADAPSVLIAITDEDFPPNQAPTRQLAGGVATLDNFLFVLDSDGTIWHSAFGDPSSWNALDFITAERERDEGIYIGKHHDNIFVIGSKSTEFFYNAGNATGSVLRRRQDIAYLSGCPDRKAIYDVADRVAFIGSDQNGTLGLYQIEKFQLKKLSGMSVDESLSFLGLRRDNDFVLSMAMINDHLLIYVSPVLPETSGLGNPIWKSQSTLVFDVSISVWSQYRFDLKDIGGFPIIDISYKDVGTNRSVGFLFLNGDLAEPTNALEPIDTIGILGYFEPDDYIENQNDYILNISQDQQDTIHMQLTLPDYDSDTIPYKYGHSLWVVGTTISNSEGTVPIEIDWSDDHYNTFSHVRELDVSMRRKLTRLGNFRRRAHRLNYKGPDTLRLEALEIDIRGSKYA